MLSHNIGFLIKIPHAEIAFMPVTWEANQENLVNIKKRFHAVLIWISKKLPYTGPRFQISYDANNLNEEEE